MDITISEIEVNYVLTDEESEAIATHFDRKSLDVLGEKIEVLDNIANVVIGDDLHDGLWYVTDITITIEYVDSFSSVREKIKEVKELLEKYTK